jgi:peptidoglycan hydrolase CwlO-like protein
VVSSPPPLSGSYASLFKEQVEDNKEDDSMLSIIEDMKTIRNDIDVDTKKANSIKEQIKKLQEELDTTEEKVKKNKHKLKELAVKIAEC